MEELIKEYRAALQWAKRRAVKTTNEEDRKILNGCIDSLLFTIEYMETGRYPNSRRGITRLAYTQREIPVDPENIAFIKASVLQRQSEKANHKMQNAFEDLAYVFSELTEKEREAFNLVRANGYSFAGAAGIMNIQKSSVQVMVKRAEEKIYNIAADVTEKGISFKVPVQMELF